MNAASSSGVATTSMGKNEWNASTDWMRVVRARGSVSSVGASRTRAAHARSGVGRQGGGVGHRGVVSAGRASRACSRRDRRCSPGCGWKTTSPEAFSTRSATTFATGSPVAASSTTMDLSAGSASCRRQGIVTATASGVPPCDDGRVQLHHRPVVAPRRPLRAGRKPGRPVSRLPDHAVHHVGEGGGAVQGSGVGRGLAAAGDQRGGRGGRWPPGPAGVTRRRWAFIGLSPSARARRRMRPSRSWKSESAARSRGVRVRRPTQGAGGGDGKEVEARAGRRRRRWRRGWRRPPVGTGPAPRRRRPCAARPRRGGSGRPLLGLVGASLAQRLGPGQRGGELLPGRGGVAGFEGVERQEGVGPLEEAVALPGVLRREDLDVREDARGLGGAPDLEERPGLEERQVEVVGRSAPGRPRPRRGRRPKRPAPGAPGPARRGGSGCRASIATARRRSGIGSAPRASFSRRPRAAYAGPVVGGVAHLRP